MVTLVQSGSNTPMVYDGSAFFSHGFRPFFFSASVFAGLAIPLWMAAFSHGYRVGPNGNAMGWHAHEMVFGYVAAVIAGFAMTAIANWTGRAPIRGWPLAMLFLLWLAGRVAMFVGANAGVIAVIDCLFLFAVAAAALREVSAGKNWRNLPVCALITLLAVSNFADHAGDALRLPYQTGLRSALAVITALMMLIGGRIIPAFTTNWLRKQGMVKLPVPMGPFDQFTLLVSIFVLIGWIAFPLSEATGYGLLIIAFLHIVRLSRWRGWSVARDPLVLVLHLAYLWLPVAFGLMALAIFRPDILTSAHALHALTTGAIGQLTMAVMTRASLGHCGRKLRAGFGTVVIYLLVFVGAMARLALPFTGIDYALGMSIAGIIWAAGFLLFALVYGPMLLAPRR